MFEKLQKAETRAPKLHQPTNLKMLRQLVFAHSL